MARVFPAILTSDETDYHQKLLKAEHVSDLIHVDIVDGHFANNTTIGPEIIKKNLSSSMLEIQLLVHFPQNYIDQLISIDYISRFVVPFESPGGLWEVIYHIKNHQKQVGLSINPQTPVKAALHFLDDVDFLQLLAVEPGFSGQKFQEEIINKLKEVKRLVSELPVAIDGGVNFDNTPKLVEAGADFLVVNSALYKASDFYLAYEKLANLATKTS